VYAAPRYLARVGTPTHPRELEAAPHRVVGYASTRTGKPLPIALERRGDRVEVQGRHAVAIDDGNAYLAAGVAGLGVLWLPRYMAEGAVARGELVPLFDGWQAGSMPLHLVLPSGRHMSARLRAFVAWVEGVMARHAPLGR